MLSFEFFKTSKGVVFHSHHLTKQNSTYILSNMLNLSNTVIIIIAIATAICGVIVAAIVIYRRRRQNRKVEQPPWSADSKLLVTSESSNKT